MAHSRGVRHDFALNRIKLELVYCFHLHARVLAMSRVLNNWQYVCMRFPLSIATFSGTAALTVFINSVVHGVLTFRFVVAIIIITRPTWYIQSYP